MWELSWDCAGELLEFCGPGVYAMVNHVDRKVDVRHGTNCLQAIARHYSQLVEGTHACKALMKDRDKIRFVMLERIHHLQYRMMAQSYYLDGYKNQGYNFYRYRPASSYRVKTKLEYLDGYQMVVRLENANHDSFVVGVFSRITDAQAFVDTYYQKKIPFPVYACNKETRKYLRR